MIIFIKLFLAHLIGDFFLQSNAWVAHKETRKSKSIFLYFHLLLHGIIAWILVGETAFWSYALALALSHGMIDLLKLHFQKPRTKRLWFIADQILHLIAIGGIALLWNDTDLRLYEIDNRLDLRHRGCIADYSGINRH